MDFSENTKTLAELDITEQSVFVIWNDMAKLGMRSDYQPAPYKPETEEEK